MSAEPKKGDIVGWKFRQGLVLGTVDHVDGDKVYAKSVHTGTMVTHHREKVLLRSELDEGDVQTALKQGGHMARRKTHPKGAKAAAMGLKEPTQAMPEPQARAAKKKRAEFYEHEAEKSHPHPDDAGRGRKRSRKGTPAAAASAPASASPEVSGRKRAGRGKKA